MRKSFLQKISFIFLVLSITLDIESKARLKILFLVSEFPKFNQTFILNQITGMIDRGHEVTIFAKRPAGQFMPPEVQQYKLLEKTIYKTLPVNNAHYDIIFAQFGREGIFGTYLKKKGVTGKLVTCFRGDEITKPLAKKPHYYDDLFANGDLFLPVCDFFKQILISNGCPSEKIITHYSGIHLKKFEFKAKKNYLDATQPINVITVCRLVEKKGIKYAIKAVAKIYKYNKNISYTIIGDGPEKENLIGLIKKLNMQKIIHLHGWLAHEEIAQALQNAHVFIHPSLTATDHGMEGIPNTVKEAMACGVPVISTHHAGIPELIKDKITGLLVPEKTSGKLAHALQYLLKNQEGWNALSLKARQEIEFHFDSERLNDQLEILLYELCTT